MNDNPYLYRLVLEDSIAEFSKNSKENFKYRVKGIMGASYYLHERAIKKKEKEIIKQSIGIGLWILIIILMAIYIFVINI